MTTSAQAADSSMVHVRPPAGGAPSPPASIDRAVMAAGFICPLLLWLVVRHRPPWGDEIHFLGTVRRFGQGVSLDLLRSYDELSTPLTYLVYAAWGWVAGFETDRLRLFSVIISGAATTVAWSILRDATTSRRMALLALATVAANPYFIGLSVFVFTDMLGLLGVLLAVRGVQRNSFVQTALGVAAATFTRQYLIFVAAAALAAAVVEAWRQRPFKAGAGAVVGLLPLIAVVHLWDWHLLPAGEIALEYTPAPLAFDLTALSLYLSVPALYLAPIVISSLAPASSRRWAIAGGLVVAAFVLLNPVRPSPAQIRNGIQTVGFVHRGLTAVVGHPGGVQAIFVALGFLWGSAIGEWSSRLLREHRFTGFDLFLALAVLAFYAAMPFGFVAWEKYLLPLFPLIAIIGVRCWPAQGQRRHASTMGSTPDAS